MDKLYEEMENEVDNMTEEEMLYVRMSPQDFIMKKFNNQINHSKQLIEDIESNSEVVKKNENEIKQQNLNFLNECNRIKLEIEQTKQRINKLMLEKQDFNKRPEKNEFISSLDNELKTKFKTPDNCFRDFLANKMSLDEFTDKMKEMGTGKNYYYYKVLSEKLKEMP